MCVYKDFEVTIFFFQAPENRFRGAIWLMCYSWGLRPIFSLHPAQFVTQEAGDGIFCPSCPAEIPDGCSTSAEVALCSAMPS